MDLLKRGFTTPPQRTKPSLAVCCMTSDPPGQVARSLALLKPLVDEINVAVDSRVDERLLGPLLEISDQLWRFDFRPPVDRPRAWLASQCKADWIFWMDGDEIPSPDLLSSIGDAIVSRDVLQFLFTRRWLYPDERHWLEENPWWPDVQIRLVRNDPATMRFETTHVPIGPTPPFRLLDAPLYHLAALAPSEVRAAKIRRYDTERPGMISPAGGPFNDVLLTPEFYARRPPAPVPSAHQSAIAAVLHSQSPEAPGRRGAGRRAVLVPPHAIDALSPARKLTAADYRARITCVEVDKRFAPGVTRDLLLRISNDGGTWWPRGGQGSPCMNLSYHLLGRDNSMIAFDGRRTSLPSNLAPGETMLVLAGVEPPTEPGRYVVLFDMVHELVRWFGNEARVEIDVAPQTSREGQP